MTRRREVFVSVVVSFRNAEAYAADFLHRLGATLAGHFERYEIVAVDEASTDGTLASIEGLQRREKNIQLYALPRWRGENIGIVAGLDHAIGDLTVIMHPRYDPPELIPQMVDLALTGADVVYALPRQRVAGRGAYNHLVKLFLAAIARVNRIDMPRAMSSYRLFSRTLLNAILEAADRHRILSIAPALFGARYATLEYDQAAVTADDRRALRRTAVARALSLTFSSSVRPLRIITLFSLGISVLSFFYAGYAILVKLLMREVAEGWTSLSLQVSGLFFLVCIVLAVMSEYLLQVIEMTNRRSLYHIARQSHSATLDYAGELNVVADAGERAPSVSGGRPPA